MGKGLINLLANRIAARIPHQSEIGSEEPISASFPPGEAKGAARRRRAINDRSYEECGGGIG